MQVVKAAALEASPQPLVDWAVQTVAQHSLYQGASALEASGLSCDHRTELGKLAACIEHEEGEAGQDDCQAPAAGHPADALATGASRHGSDRSRLLHCHLQIELLWVLNWSLHLMGVT